MIEESFLPMGLLCAKAQQFFAQDGSQHSDPALQGHFRNWEVDEEVNVVRHDDITADRDVMFRGRAQAKRAKDIMYFGTGEKRKTPEVLKVTK